MGVMPGDIIERGGKYWAVVELERATPNGLPDALVSDGREAIRVSTRGMVAVASAYFAPGMTVKFATIIEQMEVTI
jgi:hypothetical protein